MAGASVYRWEINIREATILGLVGAGGIGMALQSSIDALVWSRVSVILVAILATVALAEWVSARVRRRFR
jgi:phosphonate transport system permease protein